MLKLALAQTQAQMGSRQDAGPVVAVFPRMPSFRANSVAPFVPSPPVAGKTTHLVFSRPLCCPYFVVLLITRQIFLFHRSSPGEARESQAVEGERLGKRVRKKRKIYMDSGDEEEENQEEPEVSRRIIAFVSGIVPFQSYRPVKYSLLSCCSN